MSIVAVAACSDTPPSTSQRPGDVPAPTGASGTCPEAMAGFVPSGMNLTERAYADSGDGSTAVRTQFIGPGSRELTLLSGVAGEIPLGRDTGTRRTIRGYEASIRSGSPDTRIAWWLEGPEGDPCSQYAVIASGLSAAEFEAVLDSVR